MIANILYLRFKLSKFLINLEINLWAWIFCNLKSYWVLMLLKSKESRQISLISLPNPSELRAMTKTHNPKLIGCISFRLPVPYC